MKENIKVIIYSSSLCAFCYKAKALLIKKNISYHEINVDDNFDKKQEMITKSKGRTSVPQIFFGEVHIGGCDDLLYLEKTGALININE